MVLDMAKEKKMPGTKKKPIYKGAISSNKYDRQSLDYEKG